MSAFRQIFCLKILNPHIGLLSEIQLELEKRRLSLGDWASGMRATLQSIASVDSNSCAQRKSKMKNPLEIVRSPAISELLTAGEAAEYLRIFRMDSPGWVSDKRNTFH
jgi:hypothetical protein